jgi:DNA-binding LacI/PurR family transcriptional regulator
MPRRPTKSRAIATVLEERIRRGDYVLHGLQSDRSIAEEFDVSRLTANQALRMLVEKGIVRRKPNGRLELPGAEGVPSSTRQIAFLAPSFPSPFLQRLRVAAEQVAIAAGCSFRPIDYLHWTDQVVYETLAAFDGVILCSPGGMMPESLLPRIESGRAGVLCLNVDLSALGIPGLVIDPPEDVQTLCDHMAGLGHRSIDCLQVHGQSPGLSRRVQQWQLWTAAHGMDGSVHVHESPPYANTMLEAYRVVRQLQAAGALRGTGLLCTTELATIGACRALVEAGRVPGRDISICTFGGDGMCRFANPSITCLEHPDLAPYLSLWTSWIVRGRTGWIGPLLLRPQNTLFCGETTAPPGGWPDGPRRVAAAS